MSQSPLHRGPRKIGDFVGKGGARERPELLPEAEAEERGLCDDASDAVGCICRTVDGGAGDAEITEDREVCRRMSLLRHMF